MSAYEKNQWSRIIAWTQTDPNTGQYLLADLPAKDYALRFSPGDGYNAWEWYGDTFTQERATPVSVGEAQAVTGVDDTLPKAADVTMTFTIANAPKVHKSQAWAVNFDPDTGSNTVYSISGGGMGDLNGTEKYSWTVGGLPPGEYRLCAYLKLPTGKGYDYPYNYGSSMCSPGHASIYGDVQGPFFTVKEGESLSLDGGSMIWPSPKTELAASGYNASEKFCGCTRGDPINTFDGSLSEESDDLSLAGVGPEISATRAYSSSASTTLGSFGYGWASNLDMRLQNPDGTLDADTQPNVVDMVQENGAVNEFYQDSETWNGIAYAANGRLQVTLTWDADASLWRATRNGLETFLFSPAGQLLKVQDVDGNTVSYTRDASGTITSISGSGGRQIDFTTANGLVTRAADSAGRSYTYVYDADQNLTAVTDATGAVTQFAYSASHLITTMTKPNGGTTSNTWDSSGRVTKQTDPLGRATTYQYTNVSGGQKTLTTTPWGTQTADFYVGNLLTTRTKDASRAPVATSYTYDNSLNVATVTDSLGAVQRTTWDGTGHALTSTAADGAVTAYTNDARGNPLKIADPLGRTSTFTYDAANRPLTASSAAGRTTAWSYNTDGTLATSTNARGGKSTYTYDARGLQTSITDPGGHTSKTAYDAAGFVVTTTDPAGQTSTVTRDAAGRSTGTTDANKHSSTSKYDLDGNLIAATDGLGNTTKYAYDAADERISQTTPTGATTSWQYNDDGQVASQTDPLGKTTTYDYGTDQVSGVTDPLGHQTWFSYDGNGRLLTTTLPSGAKQSNAYDAVGRLTSTTDELGKVTNYTYNAASQMTSKVDALGRKTTYEYNSDGLPARQTLPGGSVTSRTYDADGDVLSEVNADQRTTSFTYDSAGLLLSRTAPGGLTTKFTYDADGRVITTTRPDGTTVTNTWDAVGNPIKQHSSVTGTTDIVFSYDPANRRTGMADATGSTSFTLDAAGLLLKETNGVGTALSYTYDAAGQNSTITYPGARKATYAYDAAGRMTSVQDWNAKTTTFAYNVNDQLTKIVQPNGVSQTLTRNLTGDVTAATAATTKKTLSKYTYAYDAARQVTSDTTVDASTTGITRTFTYDSVGQVASATTGSAKTTLTASTAGVLSQVAAGSITINAAQQPTKLTPASGGATTFTYTANGNRSTAATAASGSVAATSTSYSWNGFGDLASVTLPGTAGTEKFAYDGDHLRQTRTIGSATTKYTWSHREALTGLLDDGSNALIYGPGGRAVEQVSDSNQTPQYLTIDALSSVRMITDASGASIGTASYDTFGKVTKSGTATSAIGYTGALTDPSSGLVYLRARDYDPTTGQFLAVDPILTVTGKPYAYAENNPLSKTDPTGLAAQHKPQILDTLMAYWISGLGPRTLHYGPSDFLTYQVQNTFAAYHFANVAQQDIANGKDSGGTSYSPEGKLAAGWEVVQDALKGLEADSPFALLRNLIPGKWAIPFLGPNDAQAFLGGFSATWTISYLADCTARVHYHATNITGWESLLRNPATGKTFGKNTKTGPGSNLTETFDWYEDYSWGHL